MRSAVIPFEEYRCLGGPGLDRNFRGASCTQQHTAPLYVDSKVETPLLCADTASEKPGDSLDLSRTRAERGSSPGVRPLGHVVGPNPPASLHDEKGGLGATDGSFLTDAPHFRPSGGCTLEGFWPVLQ